MVWNLKVTKYTLSKKHLTVENKSRILEGEKGVGLSYASQSTAYMKKKQKRATKHQGAFTSLSLTLGLEMYLFHQTLKGLPP